MARTTAGILPVGSAVAATHPSQVRSTQQLPGAIRLRRTTQTGQPHRLDFTVIRGISNALEQIRQLLNLYDPEKPHGTSAVIYSPPGPSSPYAALTGAQREFR